MIAAEVAPAPSRTRRPTVTFKLLVRRGADVPSTLDLTDAVRYATDRIATRNGALLVGAYVLVQLVVQVTTQSLAASLVGGGIPAETTERLYPLAVDVSATVSGGLTLLFVLAGTVLGILTMRAFHRDIDRFPTADHTRRLVRTLVVALVVSLIVFVAITVGTVLFVIPGIFLAVSLVFAVLVVAIEDAGVVESLRRSWALTSGNRLRLFLLGVAFVVVSGVVGGLTNVAGIVAPITGGVVAAILAGAIGVFGVGLLVGAYRQLSDDDGATEADPSATTL